MTRNLAVDRTCRHAAPAFRDATITRTSSGPPATGACPAIDDGEVEVLHAA